MAAPFYSPDKGAGAAVAIDHRPILLNLQHEQNDAAELLCAAIRLNHLADLLDRCTRDAGTDFIGTYHHARHCLPDGTCIARAGLEKAEDNRFYERFDNDLRSDRTRPFAYCVEVSNTTEVDTMIRLSSADLAARLQSYSEQLVQVARKAPDLARLRPPESLGPILVNYVQAGLAGQIPSVSASLQTTIHASGHIDVAMVPRTPSRFCATNVFKPAALAALATAITPAATLTIKDENRRVIYRLDAVREVLSLQPVGDDAMAKLRIHALLPDLGKDPFTEPYIALHAALAR